MSGYIFLSEGNDSEILSSDDDDKFIIKHWISIRNSQSNFWEYVIWLLTIKMIILILALRKQRPHTLISDIEEAILSTSKLVVDKIL